jgi:hypothetical protein
LSLAATGLLLETTDGLSGVLADWDFPVWMVGFTGTAAKGSSRPFLDSCRRRWSGLVEGIKLATAI